MIKILYVVLVLSIAALVAVAIAVYLRVRRHLERKIPDGEAHIADGAAIQGKGATAPEDIDYGQSSDGSS